MNIYDNNTGVESTQIPFNDYLFNTIRSVDKTMLDVDLSYDDLICNQNKLRTYFQLKYPTIRFKYNDFVSLFILLVIFEKYENEITSWEMVGDLFYNNVTDGYKMTKEMCKGEVNLYESQRICMCSNHSPVNFYCYVIDHKYCLLTGSVCVKKSQIVDVNIIRRIKQQERAERKAKTEKKVILRLNKLVSHLSLDKRLQIIGLYKLLNEVESNKAKNKLIKKYTSCTDK